MVAHVSQAKKLAVASILKQASQYPIVGIVNMQNLPSAQLGAMRKSLREEGVVIVMTKKRLLKLIFTELEATKPGISQLTHKLVGMPALIFAKDNAFKLYKKIQSKKTSAPAKPGQLAPHEIVVKAGPTPFSPGPIISQLAQVKIKAGIEAGKVVIKADSVVVKENEPISGQLAGILAQLGITPMEIGLDVVAMFEHGTVYGKDILAVDEKTYIAQLTTAHAHAFNLAVECVILNADTTAFLIGKAFKNAKALSLEATIPTSETIADLLAKGNSQAQAVYNLTQK
jgi:large subunit ribosomal protein L10